MIAEQQLQSLAFQAQLCLESSERKKTLSYSAFLSLELYLKGNFNIFLVFNADQMKICQDLPISSEVVAAELPVTFGMRIQVC